MIALACRAFRGGDRRGFTLLEVLVATSILGLGLTAILSAQVGLFATSARTEKLSVSTGLLRCKMSEIEEKLVREGYPLVDESDEGPCCDDDEAVEGYRCSWTIETVELPDPQPIDSLGDGGTGSGMDESSLGALGALAAVEQSGGSVLGQSADLGSVADLLGSSPVAGTQSMAPLVMSLVYPNLKPMLEASIRKVTVKIEWDEGKRKRDLSAVQYVTSPQQGGIDPTAAEGIGDALEALGSQLGGMPVTGAKKQ